MALFPVLSSSPNCTTAPPLPMKMHLIKPPDHSREIKTRCRKMITRCGMDQSERFLSPIHAIPLLLFVLLHELLALFSLLPQLLGEIESV